MHRSHVITHPEAHVGTYLWKIKTNNKDKKLVDGKGTGREKGRLTDKIMNAL